MLPFEVAFALVAHRETEAGAGLLGALGAASSVLTPAQAAERLRAGDVALGRLDVLPSLEGVEPGLAELDELERRGVVVLNSPQALLASHDKLLTARLLNGHDVPHPRTAHVGMRGTTLPIEPPLVLKPRFGSWGAGIELCRDEAEFDAALARIRQTTWFQRHGAIVQELVPPVGRDLRVLVAGERVVGAIERVAAPGEWRTNVSLGARRQRVVPPPAARRLAMAAAVAVDGDLVGVDLLPTTDGGFVVLEVNGAVDFTRDYSLGSRDVFAAAAAALLREAARRVPPSRVLAASAVAF